MLSVFEPQCNDFAEWFAELIAALKLEISAAIDEMNADELTDETDAPTIDKIDDSETSAKIDANAIDEHSSGDNGNAGNAQTNEETSS